MQFLQLILFQWISLDINVMEKYLLWFFFNWFFFFFSVYELLITFRKNFPEFSGSLCWRFVKCFEICRMNTQRCQVWWSTVDVYYLETIHRVSLETRIKCLYLADGNWGLTKHFHFLLSPSAALILLFLDLLFSECWWVAYFQCNFHSHSPKSALEVKLFRSCSLIIFLLAQEGVLQSLYGNQQLPVSPALVRNAYLVLSLCTWACTKILMANWFQTYPNRVAVASQDCSCCRISPLKGQVLFHNSKCICSSLLNGLFTTAQPHNHWEPLRLEA